MKADPSYQDKVTQQLAQYASVELLHTLPAIRDYWFEKFIRPRVRQVFYEGEPTAGNFYTNTFETLLCNSSDEQAMLLSLGPGDCKHEVAIAKELKARGLGRFQLECLELSDSLLERGRQMAVEAGVSDLMIFSQGDLNDWKPRRRYNGVMAHHAVHHFVELERIFSGIVQCIGTTGIFVTCDVIGRNGHLLWPETLNIVESLWSSLAPEKKFHHQFKKTCNNFPNHDCSTEGFEGIRAQDILPLLNDHFSFEHFLAYGGLTDPFVGRGFGANFKPDAIEDRTFIDTIQATNDALCDSGYLKPTRMMAIMRHPDYRGDSVHFRHWSPAFCRRIVSKD